MNKFVKDRVKEIKKVIGKQNRVLEVGSLNINGSVRSIFKDAEEYIGLDMQKGKGVDIVASSYEIPKLYPNNTFDCVICCETLEHDIYFWITLDNMRNVLKPGGWLIISAPSLDFPYHAHPRDYYRFLPDVFVDVFFHGYEEVDGMIGYGVEKNEKIDPAKDVRNIVYYGKKPQKV